MHSLDLWTLYEEGHFEGRRVPWPAVVRYIGGLHDACGLWHPLVSANDEAVPVPQSAD